jgi:hypothetical protein
MIGAGALAISAAMGRDGAGAQPADTKPFRIDVHHHLSPPTYVTASNDGGFGDPLMKNWTIEKSLDDMDRAGIAIAMLSVTTPAVNFTKGDAARKLCRESNEAQSLLRIIPDGSAISRCCRSPTPKAACAN